MRQLFRGCIHIAGSCTARIETRHRGALDHRRIVAVGNDGAAWCKLMRILDHRKERFVLLLAVYGPVGVEYLVAAMFAIGLREHHQFDVGRIAFGCCKCCEQVIDFIIGQCQAKFRVSLHQRVLAALRDIDECQRLRIQLAKQAGRLVGAAQDHFSHAIVQQGLHCGDAIVRQFLRAAEQTRFQVHHIQDAALYPVYACHAAVMRNVGRLAGPG